MGLPHKGNTALTRYVFSWWLAILAIAGLPLFRGGYTVMAEAAFVTFCGLSLLLAPLAPKNHTLGWLASFLWVMWLAWLLVQIVPFPGELLSKLAPQSSDIWDGLNRTSIEHGARVSIYPDGTLRLLIVSLGLFCLWLSLKANLQHSPELIQRTFVAIVCITFFQALYGTIAHLGVWQWPLIEPTGYAHHSVAHGSFANRNHYAAVLVLGAAATLALMLKGNHQQQRSGAPAWLDFLNQTTLVYRVALFVLIVAIVLTQSRMGNISLSVGLATFAFIWLLQTNNLRSFMITAAVFASIAFVDVLLISDQFGLDRVIERIETTDIDSDTRSLARALTLDAIGKYGAMGSGLGSFSRVESYFDPRIGGAPLVYAHNDHLQIILEAGWIGYGLLATLLVVHLMHALFLLKSQQRFRRAIGAATVMIGVTTILHMTVEFILYTPAWRALFVALLSSAMAIQPPSGRRLRHHAR